VIVRSWNIRPRPGRYDDSIGLITEGVKLADRHGASDIRLTQAATDGPNTGVLVLTCEFENLTAYGSYIDDTMTDAEAQSFAHRVREAEAPFTYESTAVLVEIDLDRPNGKKGRGRVLDARYGRPLPGRWDDMIMFARNAFDLTDKHGGVGCRLFELNQAGVHSGWLSAVMEFESMTALGKANDSFMADEDARKLIGSMRANPPFEPMSAGIFTEVAIF
jgi:hypothetical protein